MNIGFTKLGEVEECEVCNLNDKHTHDNNDDISIMLATAEKDTRLDSENNSL